ncbi:MAG: XdhC family protein [Desulfovibrionaceae bacterium]
MNRLIRKVSDLLAQGTPLVLVSIVAHAGSTPRSSGAKMAVQRDGSLHGTVGGGLVEAMACRKAVDLFSRTLDAALLLDVDLSNDDAAMTDMICGGKLTLLLERIEPGREAAVALAELDRLLRAGRSAVMLSVLEGHSGLRATQHALLAVDEAAEGVAQLSAGHAALLRDQALAKGAAGVYELDGLRIAAEPFVPPAPLLLFGAGHVSQATARIGAMAGFRTVVLDDRAEFANASRFPDVDQIVVLDSLDNALVGQEVGENAFLVIMTRGHVHDKTVLAQALRTPARYVGMIGSRKKREAVYASLRKEGVADAAIARCHCPIGLEIGAQSPEEIAVSILAELIAVRAGGRQ